MKRTRKFYAVLALLTAVSMLAAGCSSDNTESAEGTSISVNVIGGDNASDDNSAGETPADGTSPAETAPSETLVVTDDNGETMTGVGGNVLTEIVTTAPPVGENELSEEEMLAIMFGSTTGTKLEIPVYDTSTRYGYTTLNDEEKALYNAIVEGARNFRYKICPEDAFTLEEWAKIYGMVYNQEPQLFYLSPKIKVGTIFYITKDVNEINTMQKSIDKTVNALLEEANAKSTTFDKLKVFHDYLVLNSTFLLEGEGYNTTIYNAFGSDAEQGELQCSGYARSMQYLCDKAGITSMVVSGTTNENRSHAWNIVKVDGEWYNLDVTWDDPQLTETTNYKNIRYSYFLIPDSEIHGFTHLDVNKKKLSDGSTITYFAPPACTATAENYFVKSGKVYSDFESADAAIKAEIERVAKDGSRTAHIKLASKDVYDQVFAERKNYNEYAKTFDGVKSLSDLSAENLLIIELAVNYE